MKTKSVQSKFKNPDKHIEKLKDEISRLQSRINYKEELINRIANEKEELISNAFGAHWFDYSNKGTRIAVDLKSEYEQVRNGNIRMNTKIVATGQVCDIKMDQDSTIVGIMIKTVYVKV